MTLRWLTFFGILFGCMGAFIFWQARKPLAGNKYEDEFIRRKNEAQQSTHTDYME